MLNETVLEWKRFDKCFKHDAALREFYVGRNVLVTGADGFIGMNMVFALLALGANVTITTRRASPRIAKFPGRVVNGDLRDEATVQAAVQGQSAVFDLAGNSGAVWSNRRPAESLETECLPHLNLYQACAAMNPSPVVLYCSSRLVYGKPEYLPVDELHPTNPWSMYAVHKVTVENYLHVFSRTKNLRVCVIRLSNPFGPHQASGTKNHGILNQFIRQAVRGNPITIFGDGRQERDYIYITDVVLSMLRAMGFENCYGQTFNLGGRARMSIIDTARRVAHLAGGTPVIFEPWPANYKSVETGDYQTDLSKLDSFITPHSQTGIDDGVIETMAYYREAENERSIETSHVD